MLQMRGYRLIVVVLYLFVLSCAGGSCIGPALSLLVRSNVVAFGLCYGRILDVSTEILAREFEKSSAPVVEVEASRADRWEYAVLPVRVLNVTGEPVLEQPAPQQSTYDITIDGSGKGPLWWFHMTPAVSSGLDGCRG